MPSFLSSGLVAIKVSLGASGAWREVCHSRLELFMTDVSVVALIDTGASMTVVDRSIVEHLHIHQKGSQTVRVLGSGGAHFPTYDVWLKVMNRDGAVLFDEPNHSVICAELDNEEYFAILGMDVLQSFTLRMNRPAGVVEMLPTGAL